MTIQPWRAVSVQMKSELAVTAPDHAAAWKVIDKNIACGLRLIEAACAEYDAPKVFVTPEFAFQGAPHETPVAEWIDKACCPIPGPITAPFQSLAKRKRIYIGGNQFETDPEWPGRYFNTCFLIGPEGDIILRYRRITTAAFPSPHDFMDAYMARYTAVEAFPVVETELGRIAMIACSEIAVPEVARVMMMQGAEIILHPTNGKKSASEDAAKIARCAENKVYLVSANVAGPIGFSIDRTIPGGRSRIIDFTGEILAFEPSAEEGIGVSALIDVEALRRNRTEDTGPSSLLRARWEMYRPFFAKASFYPPNSFLDRPMIDMADTESALAASRRNFAKAGITVAG